VGYGKYIREIARSRVKQRKLSYSFKIIKILKKIKKNLNIKK